MARLLRLLVAVLTTLGAIGISAAQPTEASGTQVANCSFVTLQKDLQAGGDWYYTAGQCPSPIISTSQITIISHASLTAQGNDVTLDGGGDGVFYVNPGTTLGLTGLTLSHDHIVNAGGTVTVTHSTLSAGKGVAIDNQGRGTLTTSSSTLSGNLGGAIENSDHGTLTITNSTFSGNSDGIVGGAIENQGAATITSSTFSGNSALHGAAIDNAGTGTLTITSSTLSGNSTYYGGSGGAISTNGTLTVTGSTLSGNSANTGGGAISTGSVNYAVTITNSTLSGNSVIDSGSGGAINNSGATVTITNSTLSGNSTTNGDGGAVYNRDGQMTITNSTLSGNSASGGGAIENYVGTATITNSTLSGNSASYPCGSGSCQGNGGAIDNGGTVTSGGSIVASSTGENCRIAPGSAATTTDTGYNLEWSGTGQTDTCGFGGSGKHDITGTDPQVGALANNGGPTQTTALQAGSPAIDIIPTSSGRCPATDQRGAARPDNGGASCDIGAYEFGGALVTPTATPNPTTTPTSEPTPTPVRTPRVLLTILSPGSRSRYQSAAFRVAGAWQMHAVFDCSSVKTHDFHITVHAAGGTHATVHDVHARARTGNRTDRYPKGGSYYLLVQSACRWQIKVTGTPQRPKLTAAMAQAAIPQPIYFWSTVVAEITGPGRSPLSEVIRPSVIVLAPDGHWDIEQLHWTGWGSSVAHAKGISSESNGVPNMVQGKRIKTPGQVTLSSPGQFRGHEVYRCFTLTVTRAAADEHLCLKVTGGSAWLWPTTTTPSATRTATPTNASPVGAVHLLVGDGSPGRVGACSDAGGWSPAHGCPITGRLQHRLLQHPTEGRGGGGADPICRCQNSAPTTLHLHDMHGATAHVNVRWAFNPPDTITFAVLQRGSRWLVDDMYIAACPQSTSIYKNPSSLTCNGNG